MITQLGEETSYLESCMKMIWLIPWTITLRLIRRWFWHSSPGFKEQFCRDICKALCDREHDAGKWLCFRTNFNNDDDYEQYKEIYENSYTLFQQKLLSGGYKVYTSINMDVQQMLQDAVDDWYQSLYIPCHTSSTGSGRFRYQQCGRWSYYLLGFLTGSLAGASSRYITYDLGKGDMEIMKKTFGNILSIHLLLAGLGGVIGETIGLWFMTTQLQIPETRETAAFWVYQFSIISFVLSVSVCLTMQASLRMKRCRHSLT